MTGLTLTFVGRMNTEKLLADLTMREAVDYLFSPDETYQQCGAAYIQHSTFTDDKAKQEVYTTNHHAFTMLF